ncbi:MAG TPA: hypothetical protein VNT22_07545 [Baekduia sp.]|nr:hypothetical protein [Baekduia sp.]
MRILLGLTVLTAGLVAAPIAAAEIVVQKSIAGVSMGVAETDVVATLGQSSDIDTGTDPISGQPTRTLRYGKTKVTLTGGVVTLVVTTSKAQRTTDNVGIGSSEHRLRLKVKHLKCEGSGSSRFCYRGKLLPGKTVTTFSISAKKRVKRVSVGIVVD